MLVRIRALEWCADYAPKTTGTALCAVPVFTTLSDEQAMEGSLLDGLGGGYGPIPSAQVPYLNLC